MKNANWHIFQVLTKRSERLSQLNGKIKWPSNVWMGVSVETSDYKFRIDHLKNTNASTKFLSLEPLLGPISNLDLFYISSIRFVNCSLNPYISFVKLVHLSLSTVNIPSCT